MFTSPLSTMSPLEVIDAWNEAIGNALAMYLNGEITSKEYQLAIVETLHSGGYYSAGLEALGHPNMETDPAGSAPAVAYHFNQTMRLQGQLVALIHMLLDHTQEADEIDSDEPFGVRWLRNVDD